MTDRRAAEYKEAALEQEESEHRTFVNLLAAAVVLCGLVLLRRRNAPHEFNNSVLPVHSVVK